MNVLCIDTTAEKLIFALKKGDSYSEYIGQPNSKKHNSTLLPLLDNFLRGNGINIQSIDVFGVVVGPGSFTGIRIGVATVNAFALANSKPVIEITVLEQFLNAEQCFVGISCKHDNYYCALKKSDEIIYRHMNIEEIKKNDDVFYEITGSTPKTMMQIALEKIEHNKFVKSARPFYMKKSSAERETGIEYEI